MRAGRVVAVVATLTMATVLGLSACGSKGTGQSSSSSTTSTTTSAPGQPTGVLTVDDIPFFADGKTLDAFLPDPRPSRPVPAVVLVHGGGWVGGERSVWAPYAERMVREQGWAVFSIDYDVASTDPHAWPDEFHEVQAAVRFVAGNAQAFGIDAARIAVLGESAGGNLAALVSSIGTVRTITGSAKGEIGAGSRVNAITVRGAALEFPSPTLDVPIVVAGLWSAPTELAPLAPPAPGTAAPGCGSNAACEFAWDSGDVVQYLGCRPATCPAKYAEASPIDQVTRATSPSFVSNSTMELVPVDQATDYVAALRVAGVPNQLKIVDGQMHALQTADAVWDDTMAFFARYLD
jgi:acetyl esterase/lipase